MPARDFSLDTLLKANAAIYAAREASIDGHQRLTWTELDQRTGRMAQWLLARGIGPGDRVALLLTDGAPFVTTLLACGRIGAIAVLLNWRLAPGEIGWIMGNAEVAMTFANPRFAPLLAESETGALIIVDEGHDPQGAFEAIVSAEQPARPMPALDPDRPLYMMYTSGTTGKPKGCLQSGTAVATAAIAMALRRSWGKDTRLLSVNPLFHVVGMQQVAAMLACGGAMVFAGRDDDSAAILDLLHREACTTTSAFPTICFAWQAMEPVRGGVMPLVDYTGGAGMRPSIYDFIERDWDARVVGGYGQTEICGFATAIDYPEMLDHPRSIGWPMAHIEMCILDPEGNRLQPGEEGEIALRSPAVMLGYWRNPEATEAALGHGWLRTGDLGTMDERGLGYLLGRAKELIKTGGENVYPAEVDAVFAEMPEVADAGCCGVPDRQWGEAVKAFVVLKPGMALTREEITARFKGRIAGYKRPRYIEFVDTLPRDPIGKLQRRELSARPVTPDQAA
ncbi:class I adenylate-forming enzyme family protein [Altererythrobacter sp. H2]|uniref:class I adenylate-forming enzyme family protein n=1 Tax=Altererythrobacter sp. H2 TaxID=3108391 RepID=UPI002B4BE84F|nr:class I adenylate-forming enzyme family protein [Altererythrobacter sp. H2]WRK97040.1 class I adenylate-forming enzyme family protein [Altererythrobacter sp. H2]